MWYPLSTKSAKFALDSIISALFYEESPQDMANWHLDPHMGLGDEVTHTVLLFLALKDMSHISSQC